MVQYKIKDAGVVDGIVIIVSYPEISISWSLLKLED